jgi:hypothetical protein
MLHEFIEKNINRKVYICEQLYLFGEINISQIATILETSKPTIMNDIKFIIDKLQENKLIQKHTRTKDKIHIEFNKNFSILKSTQLLYNESLFLRFLIHYFENQFSIIELQKIEFLSIGTIYKFKKLVLDFFDKLGYLKENNQIIIPEFDYRNILLIVFRYTGWRSFTQLSVSITNTANKLIDYVENQFLGRFYPSDERSLIIEGYRLILLRRELYPIKFDYNIKEEVSDIPLYTFINDGLNLLDIHLEKDEIIYLFYLFNSREYLNKDVQLVENDTKVIYSTFVRRNEVIYSLEKQINKLLHFSIKDSVLLQKSFTQFIKTLWADGQLFLPDKIFLLDNKQSLIYDEMIKLIESWKKQYNIKIRINTNLLRKFVLEISLYKKVIANNEQIEIFIVAPTVTRHFFYREKLRSLPSTKFKINEVMYTEINTIPKLAFFLDNVLILCDYACINNEEHHRFNVFPTSPKNIDNIISTIMIN